MFTLEKQTAKLTNVNPRAEMHGDEHHLAADLNFEISVSNDVLSEFSPTLKSSLYRKLAKGEGDLLPEEPGVLSKLKHPELGAIKWNAEFTGYETMIHWGVTDTQNIRLIDCAVDKFVFDCNDGGSVIVKFRVVAHPATNELGRICEMIQQDVVLSLIEPIVRIQ
jgi:hypothetical protein